MKGQTGRRALTLAVALSVAAIAVAQEDERTIVPFSIRSMRPVVEAYVNGEGPFRFVLDTGASQSMLSFDVVRDLELPESGTVYVTAPNSRNAVRAPQHKIKELKVGDLKLFNVRATAILDREFTKGLNADGILSAADFRGFMVTLDYRQRQLVIVPGRLPEADGENILDYSTRERIPGVFLDVAGEHVFFHLDSGSPFYIALPGTLLTKLSFEKRPTVIGQASTITGTFLVYQAQLTGDISFGKYSLPKPNVQFMDKMPYGNLGYRFFRDYLVTFDFSAHRIRLQHWQEASATDGGRMAG